MVPEGFCHCICRLIRVFRRASKFERIAMLGIVRLVPEGAPGVCTGMAVTSAMPSLRVSSALPCNAIGVRSVS